MAPPTPLTPLRVQALSRKFTGGTGQGQAAGWAAAAADGNLIPVSGIGTILRLKTAGTPSVATIDSVMPGRYGQDKNVTMTLGATDEQEVFIWNDGRFDQGGANAGYALVTYSSVVALTVVAKQVPGSV